MAEEVKERDEAQPTASPTPVEQPPMTEDQVLVAITNAVAAKDMKLVARLAQDLVKVQKAKEQAEREAKEKAVKDAQDKVSAAIQKAIKPFVDSGSLDSADGVWFSHDFGEGKEPVCRLLRTAIRTRTGGGGGGKKFNVSTSDLLNKYGEQEYKEGLSYNQAWESNSDKNWRYAIRESLLKRDGVIS